MSKHDGLALPAAWENNVNVSRTTQHTHNFRDLVFRQGHPGSCTFLLEQPDMLSRSSEDHGQQSLFSREMEPADSLESQ